jgi:hypothetical protein
MERAKGFEPSGIDSQGVDSKGSPEQAAPAYTQIRAQTLTPDENERRNLFERWPSLPPFIKAAIRSLISSVDQAASPKPEDFR